MPSTRNFSILLALLLLLIFIPAFMDAQEASDCPALVQQALEAVGNSCTALDRNSACYGFNRVNATFIEAQPEDVFDAPSDRTILTGLQNIQTAALDAPDNIWGIAVMNVQANVPGSLPGQAVVFMLLGDVQVENAVDPTQAFTSAEPVNVTVMTTANARSGPSINNNVIASVPQGTQLQADALNGDKTWARVLLNNAPAWISRDLLQPEVQGTLGALPPITTNTLTPMQAFYFKTGLSDISCTESPPSILVVQGPERVKVDLTVNGANIEMGSTIGLMTTESNHLLVMTIDGTAKVGGIEIPAGFALEAPLSNDGKSLDGPWTNFRSLTPDELKTLDPLKNFPPGLLHYPIVLPSLGDIARTRAAISAPVVPRATPNPDGSEATQEAPDATQDASAEACTGFVATSPLDAATVGNQAFYWDPTPGAEGYRWVLLDENSAVLSIIDTGLQTTYTANLLPTYSALIQWEAQAFAGGQVLCSTPRVVIPLIGGGQAPVPTLTPEEECKQEGGIWDDGECYRASS
jgi:hypothetical protein